MYKCKRCGKLKAFFQLNNAGLCKDCVAALASVPAKPKPNRTYHVVGLDYYKEGIQKAFSETDEFKLSKKELAEKYPSGTKIFKYDKKVKYPAQLVPDPKNPYDKHAIMVLVNGEHIGYIDRDTAAKFNTPLNTVTDTFAKVKESPFKEITQDESGKFHSSTKGYLDVTVTLSFK